MSFSSLQSPLEEKTALNKSIRRVIFTSGQNLKTATSLIIFNLFHRFVFTLGISFRFGSLL